MILKKDSQTPTRNPKYPFQRGDFVRLKAGPNGDVGVVWQIHAKNCDSVEVCWGKLPVRTFVSHEPSELELIAPADAPEYAITLKQSLNGQG